MRLAVCLELEEVVRLLKSKDIRLQRDQSEAGAEDDAKRKLYASYSKKKHQTERHVLRNEMAEHAILRLFVSQRSDKSPNGFNCAICRKDIPFLSKGEPEIWRHFGSKTHFLRDRRYRLDHEDYLYTPRFDAVEVSSISAELRAEIEKTPAVVLGCKNPFVEDEVDALVGVSSNVPASTLVGGGVYSNSYEVVGHTVSSEGYGISSEPPCQLIPNVPTRLGARQILLLF